MKKPKESDSKYWSKTPIFLHMNFIIDLKKYCKYIEKELHDISTDNCYDAIKYCKCEYPKSPSMNRGICSICGFIIPEHKQ